MPMRLADHASGDETDVADAPDGAEVSRAAVVLVADDEPAVRQALGKILDREGYAVETAADGAEAIDRLKTRKVDALLLDLHMANHDGFETLAYVREHRRGLPMILLTGLSPSEIQQAMRQTHIDQLPPLFEKPCDPDQLLGVIELMLRGDLPTGS